MCQVLLNHFSHTLRKNPPAAETIEAVKILLKLSDPSSKGPVILDPMRDLKKTDIDYVTAREEYTVVTETMNCYTCITCPDFSEHVSHKYIITVNVSIATVSIATVSIATVSIATGCYICDQMVLLRPSIGWL